MKTIVFDDKRPVSDFKRQQVSIVSTERWKQTLDSRTRKFLDTCLKVHGDKYNYSKVKFKNSQTHIVIICPIHGEFRQLPPAHRKGKGCNQCGNLLISRKLKERGGKSQKQVISEFRQTHGNRYDYSKVKYVTAQIKVIIICPDHGKFSQSPSNHLKGHGCHECARISHSQKMSGRKSSRKLSNETIIQQFREVHGDRYDYSKVDREGASRKVTIICKQHGEFTSTPSNHKRGKGCQKCGYAEGAKKLRGRTGLNKKPQSEVIKGFKKVHGNLYDYSKVKYVNNDTKITIICKKHGEFSQRPRVHVGTGCPKCGYEVTGRKNRKVQRKSQEEVIKSFREVHGYRFFYNKVNYRGAYETVRIICRKHGGFRTTPTRHRRVNNGGCPRCEKYRRVG